MHELSLSSAVLATAIKHARGRRVTSVELRIGTLRQVIPETLEFYFAFVARDSVCDGAALQMEIVPARLRCGDCGHEWPIEIPAFRCPSCQSGRVDVMAGNEFQVESIEVEDEAPRAPALRDRPAGDAPARDKETECTAPR